MSDPTRQTLVGSARGRRAGEPPWLAALRDEALQRHLRLPFPTGREEAWRYTDVGRLHDDHFVSPPPGAVGAVSAAARSAWERARGDGASAAAWLVDGTPAALQLPDDLAARGVVLDHLERAAREQPERVRPHLGQQVGARDVFTARALARHRGGLFLYVPEGVRVPAPVRWLHWMQSEGVAVDSRALVVLGPGAALELEEQWLSADLRTPSRVQPVLELVVGEGAALTYLGWQRWGAGVRQLAHQGARLGPQARLTSLLAGFGADFARTQHHVQLAGEGSAAELLGVYFPTGGQTHEHWTVQDHRAPHTRSDLLYKGALGGQGRGVYYGTIRVSPEARRTDAYQANRNLLLSPRARVDTNPQLEIETNDVRCTHGATVGQVDEGQLYYLMSRGLPRPQAERLLVAGFFSEALARLGDAAVEQRVADQVRDKLEAL